MSSSLSLIHSFRHRIASRRTNLKYVTGAAAYQKRNSKQHHDMVPPLVGSDLLVTSTLSYRRYSMATTLYFVELQQKQQLRQISTATATISTLRGSYLFSPLPLLHSRLLAPPERRAYSYSLVPTLANHPNPMVLLPFKYISNGRYCSTRMSSTLTDTASLTNPTVDDTSRKASANNDDSKKKKPNDSNIFLDNLGTMFLIFIGSIVGWLVRSYYNGVRKNTIRTTFIESTAHADPIELDELRIANTELTPSVFYEIIQYIIDQTLTNTSTDVDNHDPSLSVASPSAIVMTYPKFIQSVRTAMMKINGEAFTIQCGHIIDRLVLAALVKYHNDASHPNNKIEHSSTITGSSDINPPSENESTDSHTTLIDQIEMPIEFWLTVLSLALYSSAKERIEILHNVFHQFSVLSPTSESSSSDTNMISMSQVVQLIGYLQDTCQLVPDAQIIMTSNKYPLQEYVVGTPEQMIDHQQWDTKADDKEAATTTDTATSFQGKNITVDMLSDILTSRSVCAWGECYKYKSK